MEKGYEIRGNIMRLEFTISGQELADDNTTTNSIINRKEIYNVENKHYIEAFERYNIKPEMVKEIRYTPGLRVTYNLDKTNPPISDKFIDAYSVRLLIDRG